MILVTGATGTVGSEVVKQLVAAKQKVRALVRDPAKAKFGGAVEIAVADLAKPETLDAAFAGVDKAFVVCAVSPDIAELEGNAYEAAKRAGAQHVVNLSASPVDTDFLGRAPVFMWHAESERRLRALGVAWTILRPGLFASGVIKMWRIMESGGLYLPSGDGKDVPIDPRDVAAVAVKVLTTPGHAGKVYVLTGPERLSDAEVVHKIATVTGKPLKFVDVPETKARQNMLDAGFPAPIIETLMLYFAAVKAGRLSVTSTVADLLGRPARTFDEWVRDHVAELR